MHACMHAGHGKSRDCDGSWTVVHSARGVVLMTGLVVALEGGWDGLHSFRGSGDAMSGEGLEMAV